MKEDRPSLLKLTNYLYRYTQSHMDQVLEEFQLSSGSYPFLLMLNKNEGISQNQISKELNVDKAMSARTIKRLIELDYIKKEENPNDARAVRLYLTDRAKAVLPKLVLELRGWVDIITEGLTIQEKEAVVGILEKIMDNARAQRDKL